MVQVPCTLTLLVLPKTCVCSLFFQYVRVSSDTPPQVIYHLMTQHWGLDAPNLLISVTGGAKNFIMKPRLKNIFRQGLVKVAQTTGKRYRGSPCNCSGRGAVIWPWSSELGFCGDTELAQEACRSLPGLPPPGIDLLICCKQTHTELD